jgi:hypothetical protein
MEKPWIETSLYTEEQIATVCHNETKDAVVIKVEEQNDKHATRLYLSYDEAFHFANAILDFVRKNQNL